MATTGPVTAKKVDLGQYTQLQQQLKSSPTAFTPNIPPTMSDLRTQAQLLQLQTQKTREETQTLKEKVYGTAEKEPKIEKPGVFQRALDVLGLPVYATTGAVEAILGKGTKKGLANIPANIKERGLMGDLLRSYNVNKWVALPLGFALDVALDPLNWVTVGTAAVIPKLFTGATRGGLKGLAVAGKAAALGKSAKALRAVPFLSRAMPGEAAVAAETAAKTARGLALGKGEAVEVAEAAAREASKKELSRVGIYGKTRTAAIQAEEEFLKTAGLPSVVERAARVAGKVRLGTRAEEALLKRFPGLKETVEKVKYSPGERFAANVAIDEELAMQRRAGLFSKLEEYVDDWRRDVLARDPQMKTQQAKAAMNSIRNESEAIANEAKKIALDPPPRDSLLAKSSAQIDAELREVAKEYSTLNAEFVREIMGQIDETGIKTWDNIRRRALFGTDDPQKITRLIAEELKNLKQGEQFWDVYKPKTAFGKFLWGYETAIGIFKVAKVPLNPASYVFATVGNMTMAFMMGLNAANPEYLSWLRQGLRIVRSKNLSEAAKNQIKGAPELLDWIKRYPKAAAETGFGKGMLEAAITRTEGKRLGDALTKAYKANKRGSVEALKAANEELEQATAAMNPRVVASLGDSFFSFDVFRGRFGQVIDQWSGSENGLKNFIADKLVSASLEKYDMVDQTWKIGTTLRLALSGITETELMRVARFVPMAAKDITKVGDLYRLSPEVAMRVAQESFMNYAAMPAAARLIRALPILGSPFISFSYAMTAKTGKTLVQNPSFFNRINFALSEVGRTEPPGPLEKAALAGPYYSYLNTRDRLKLPFMKTYPTYLNIQTWMPYLTLNWFQPSERKYSTLFGSAAGKVVDRLPFLKTPEGQIWFDYFIQPVILGESQPTGMFGQPLFHATDKFPQKLGRAAMAGVEAYVPPWMPPGYRFRQLYHALKGETPQGIPSSKSGYELATRAALASFGVSLSDIDLQNQAAAVQRTIRESTKKTMKK